MRVSATVNRRWLRVIRETAIRETPLAACHYVSGFTFSRGRAAWRLDALIELPEDSRWHTKIGREAAVRQATLRAGFVTSAYRTF